MKSSKTGSCIASAVVLFSLSFLALLPRPPARKHARTHIGALLNPISVYDLCFAATNWTMITRLEGHIAPKDMRLAQRAAFIRPYAGTVCGLLLITSYN